MFRLAALTLALSTVVSAEPHMEALFTRYNTTDCAGRGKLTIHGSGQCLHLSPEYSTRWTCHLGDTMYSEMTAYVSDDCTDTTTLRSASAPINPVCYDCDMTMQAMCGQLPGALHLRTQCKNLTVGDFPAMCDKCKGRVVAPFNKCVKAKDLELPEVAFSGNSIMVRGTRRTTGKLIGTYHHSPDCSGPVIATPGFPENVCATNVVASCRLAPAGQPSRVGNDAAHDAHLSELRQMHLERIKRIVAARSLKN